MAKINVPRFNAGAGFTTTEERSVLMSKICSTQTKPELLLRKSLWAKGIRYRVNYKKLPGCPDIVIDKNKVIVFVDGEFWHGYNWEIKKTKIKSNRNFWIPKIERNIQRDKENNKVLRNMGFTIIRFWEHQIKKDLKVCVDIILEKLN